MLTPEQKKQFTEIFEELGKTLDITPVQYKSAVKSYEFVGDWLSKPESQLARYHPEILPQGSFLLGTMIRPIHEEDDLDIDIVCRLDGKMDSWTQYDLKKIVGERLKDHDTLKKMLDKEGRRCWTLMHRESARFHLDVLAAIIGSEFRVIMEKRMSESEMENSEKLAIRITDKLTPNYQTATNPLEWLKSNPFGYAAWFKLRASLEMYKSFSMNEAVQPVPDFQERKLPLLRIVQILKRHRDIMFNGDDDKPISIVITTLAGRAYGRQADLADGLFAVVNSMEQFIEDKYIPNLGKRIKWIANPVNPEENFADKWQLNQRKQENFYKWLKQVKLDLANLTMQRGLNRIHESLASPFGEREVSKIFSNIGDKTREMREGGLMKMAAGTGMLGNIGRTEVPYHNNYGKHE